MKSRRSSSPARFLLAAVAGLAAAIGRAVVVAVGLFAVIGPAAVIGAVVIPGEAAAEEFAFFTTTDFTTGSSSVVWLDGAYTVSKNVEPVHSDAVARYHEGLIYVVNRTGADNIQVIDPAQGFNTIRQFTTGNGSNPQDVAFAGSNKMYVSRYETNSLWIMNPSTGAQTGSIDLAWLADADGLCEMAYMCIVNKRLFVGIQRIDRNNYWTPAGTSYIAVIDTQTDTVIDADPASPGTQAIALAGANPFSDLELYPRGRAIYVACPAFWGLADGGVEWVDPVSLASDGVFFTDNAAGGDILDVEIVSTHIGYAIIQNWSFNTELIRFDPSTGTKTGTLYAPGDYVIPDIDVSPDGELFVCDRTPVKPGVRIYDAATATPITTNPIDVGLPPYDITFSVPVQTGVAEDMPPAAASLGLAFPNPFNPATTIPFRLDRPAHVTLSVYDAAGRRVALLLDDTQSAGERQVVWDGRDEALREVPSGVYFARLVVAGHTAVRKLVCLR